MIETLRDFVEKMNELGMDYMVTGSYAMSAYGEIRMTRDIDVVVQLSANDIRRFFELFRDNYYVSEASIGRALERRSMFNIISLLHGGKIDCILMKETDFARTSFQRRYKVRVSGIEFWITTREDLIVAKMEWARDTLSEMQMRDVVNLTASEYDSGYVEAWIRNLGLQKVWAEVARWKTQRKNHEE